MKSKALLIALTFSLFSPFTPAIAAEPKVAIAYDIGFLGDNSFNDAVHLALKAAKKKYGLVEPFVREVPTNGTAVDRLTRLRFLAKSGYTLIIAVGPGYRQTVARVSKEYTETQFAIINDKGLGQLNVSNISFKETDGAFLAGVFSAALTKRRAVAFIGNEPDLLASFTLGAQTKSKRVKIFNVSYPDSTSKLIESLEMVDIAYSTWDGDASVLSIIVKNFKGKVRFISETPDQYFSSIAGAQEALVATVEKNLLKPIDQLVLSALQERSIIDVLDEDSGIYGREYSIKNGGIALRVLIKTSATSAVNKAVSQVKRGKLSTSPLG